MVLYYILAIANISSFPLNIHIFRHQWQFMEIISIISVFFSFMAAVTILVFMEAIFGSDGDRDKIHRC